MICLASHLPLLRVGRHEVSHYEEHWLEGVLREAAREAGHEGWWPAGDVARGVLQYLRERFEENIITLQDLFQRVSQTLRHIGFPEIASAVRPEPPPLDLCLLELAREAEGLELGFLPALMRELGELRLTGAARFELVNLRPAVLCLRGESEWTAGCRELEQEIVELTRWWSIGQSADGSRLEVLVSH
ncbi:MAG: hypothetical protein ACKV19_21390 [Verrucomicrobiales bacterium]